MDPFEIIHFLHQRYAGEEISGTYAHATGRFFRRYRFDPARHAADLTMKRSLLMVHAPVYDDGWWCDELETGIDSPWPCRTVRLMTMPFASHPDFRPEWTTYELGNSIGSATKAPVAGRPADRPSAGAD